ncbi:thioredoxin domain-containing protein [Candidatus Pacebacteria bacterium]|nr:thioredoxin domain-containing protein [Candidatus Paceibacterota bacterium]
MHTHESGIGSLALIAVIGLVLLGGASYYVSTSDESEVESELGTEVMSDSDQSQPEAMEDVERAENTAAEATLDASLEAEAGLASEDGELAAVSALAPEPTSIDTDENIVENQPVSLAGTFEDYTPAKLALAETGEVVLFFHAGWCPSCRGLEDDINANLSAIPDGVHILKVDYDSETALKKQYGVVRQHTLVQVDASGNEIKTFTGLTNTLAQVAAQL